MKKIQDEMIKIINEKLNVVQLFLILISLSFVAIIAFQSRNGKKIENRIQKMEKNIILELRKTKNILRNVSR